VRRRSRDQKRVTVGLGILYFDSADRTRRAALVVDDNGLPEQLGQFVGEHAADHVGGAAGRKRHDEADGAIRVFGIRAHNSGCCERADAGRKQMTAFHVVTPCMACQFRRFTERHARANRHGAAV
jgi:hypothetical protein